MAKLRSSSCGITTTSALLQRPEVQAFIGTDPYQKHKTKRFRQDDNADIAKNEAFILSNPETRKLYDELYTAGSALYYGDKQTFEQIIAGIGAWVDRL